MRVAKAVVLTEEERTMLTKLSRGRSTQARVVLRAKFFCDAVVPPTSRSRQHNLGSQHQREGVLRPCDQAVKVFRSSLESTIVVQFSWVPSSYKG